MERRAFLAGAAALLAAPLAAEAQPAGKVYRIGWLSPFSEPPATFRDALRELGYVEGKTFAFEIRNAQGSLRPAPRTGRRACALEGGYHRGRRSRRHPSGQGSHELDSDRDEVLGRSRLLGSGVVASFNRPGGNVTGVNMIGSDLNPKRLELLKQAVPAARKVAVLVQGTFASFEPQLHGLPEVASSLAVQLHFVEILEDATGYEAAFESMAKAGVHALLVSTSPRFNRDRRSIMELAATRRLPAVYDFGLIAIEGGLMGYRPTQAEMDRQAAKFVHKILNGANPADLPIEQPSKFELVINLKTAKALGLTIPPSVLLRADRVIE
jgi:putative tryptophan/tyrosine transport system substrate-binding protein